MQVTITNRGRIHDARPYDIEAPVWIIAESATAFIIEQRVYRATVNGVRVYIDENGGFSFSYTVKPGRAFWYAAFDSNDVFLDRSAAVAELKTRTSNKKGRKQ